MREFPDMAANDQAAREAQEERERRLRLDYQAVFGTPTGKRVLDDLMAQTGFFSDAFTGNSRTFYVLGRQSIGLHLLQMLEVTTTRGLEQMSKAALLEAMKILSKELGDV